MENGQYASLNAKLEGLTEAVQSLERAIQGAEAEGNTGILGRLATLERRTTIMWATFPIAITGGTAIGQLAARWFGLL